MALRYIDESPAPKKSRLRYLEDEPAAPAEPEISKLESGARGLGQGLSLGFADEITAGLESAFTDKTYEEARAESRANYDAAREANPKTFMAGEVTGAVAPMLVPGGQAVSAAKLAALAGLQGLGSSEADLTKGEFLEAGKDAAGSAALGFAIPKAMQGAGKVLKGAPKVLDNLAVNQGRRALGYTAADLTKNPKAVREANKVARMMLDEGVITNPLTNPLSSGADDMLARAQALKKVAGGAIDDTYTAVDDAGIKAINVHRPAQELVAKADPLQGVEAAKPVLKQYRTGVRDVMKAGSKGVPTLRQMANLKKVYKDLAFPKGVVTEAKPGITDSYHAIKTELERAVGEAAPKLGDKQLLKRYLEGKRMYGASKVATDKLTKEVGRQAGNSPFTLRGAGLAAGELAAGNPGRALAAGGATTAALRLGAQTVATTANTAASVAKKLERALRISPQRFGKWSAPLQNAAKRGPSSLATSIFLLQQNEPDFRATLDELDKEGDGEQ